MVRSGAKDLGHGSGSWIGKGGWRYHLVFAFDGREGRKTSSF